MSKASPSQPYGALDLRVLRSLAAGARHGYGILLQIHEASNNLLRIEEGSLYPALHRLETSGLLKAEGNPHVLDTAYGGRCRCRRSSQWEVCSGLAPASP